MDRIESISGLIRSYMNRCVKCESGRALTCPWISRFQAPDATAIPEDSSKAQNHEDRALLLHENAGSPCAFFL